MKYSKYIFPALVFLFALMTFNTITRAEQLGDISILPEPIERFERTIHGYVEYRIALENQSKEKEHIVEMVYPRMAYGFYGDHIQRLGRKVKLLPESRVVISLYQPCLELQGSSDVQIKIDGREPDHYALSLARQEHGLMYGWHYGSSSQDKACVLISRTVPGEIVQTMEKAFARTEANKVVQKVVSSVFRSGSNKQDIIDTFEIKRSESEMPRWSGNWLGYSRYDCVMVTDREILTAPDPVKDALIKYTECGGMLVVIGNDWPLLDSWQRKQQTEGELTTNFAGFGVCQVIKQENVALWKTELCKNLRDQWERTRQPWRQNKTIEQANKDFTVVDNLNIPARGLFILILIFALLIGPLNIMFFSKKGKRMRLFWTVPLLSLIACGAVFGYSLVSEGVTGKVRVAGLTILDETTHRATTLGWLGYYCPMTPGGGLRFDTRSELTPQVWRDYFRGGGGQGRMIDWTNGQHLYAGWVSARVPAHFRVRRSESRRERLTVRYDQQGAISVVNSLGADIEQLFLADSNGMVHVGSEIIAGATHDLKLDGRSVTGKLEALRDIYKTDWIHEIKTLSVNPESMVLDLLQPHCYIAVLDDVPFMEKGLEKAKVQESKTIIYGIME